MDAPQAQVAPPRAPDESAAVHLGPVTAEQTEQAELCRQASRFDWEYLGVMVLADAATVTLDSQVLQSSGQTAVRLLGPGLVGLSWGWSVGGTYLTLPQCSPSFASGPPPEGDVRSRLPLVISFSLLAAAMAPLIVGVETGEGPQTLEWSTTERTMRLVIASATGVVGSLMPYVLPPQTYRAMRKLSHLQAGATARGGSVSYSFRF